MPRDQDAPAVSPAPWAFFTLKTGVPGSGKTLTLVDELRRATSGENPPVIYCHNVPDLALPYMPLPVFAPLVTMKDEGGKPVQVFSRTLEVDWASVPSGSLVVIDEAQQVFPPRGSAGRVPGYVAFLNTHRHKGILIILLTQHPKLIDGAVRKLISKHQHYRRLFGGGRHICYEWDHCSDNLAGMKDATKTVAPFPKKAFPLYKSAEMHHKPRFRFPLWIAAPVLALGLFAFASPTLLGLARGEFTGKAPAVAASGASAPGAASVGTQRSPFSAGQSPAQVLSQAAAVVPSVPLPVSYQPPRYWPSEVAGCWIADECVCVLQSGRLARDLGQMCADIAGRRLEVHPSRPRPERIDPVPGGSPGFTPATAQPAASPGAPGPGAPSTRTEGGQRPA